MNIAKDRESLRPPRSMGYQAASVQGRTRTANFARVRRTEAPGPQGLKASDLFLGFGAASPLCASWL